MRKETGRNVKNPGLFVLFYWIVTSHRLPPIASATFLLLLAPAILPPTFICLPLLDDGKTNTAEGKTSFKKEQRRRDI